MNERKNIVSMRITNSDRSSVQYIAERLYVRESDVYRFAVSLLLTRFDKILNSANGGSDLLPLFLEIREELQQQFRFKKNQLYNILNSGETSPEKYVSMSDVELLLLPKNEVRKRLLRMQDPPEKNIDAEIWLRHYFSEKYFPGNPFEYSPAIDCL